MGVQNILSGMEVLQRPGRVGLVNTYRRVTQRTFVTGDKNCPLTSLEILLSKRLAGLKKLWAFVPTTLG